MMREVVTESLKFPEARYETAKTQSAGNPNAYFAVLTKMPVRDISANTLTP